MQNKIGFYISSVLVGLMLVSSMLFVVDQRQFGVVYAFGQIQNVITEPGLNFKLPPPFQNVNYIDKRLLTLDNADTEPMLTAEKQRMVIDWYVRWRITDPSQYIRNVGIDENTGAVQLARVVRNAFQEEINKRTVKELLASKREELMENVRSEVLKVVKGEKPWGIDVIDVRMTARTMWTRSPNRFIAAWRLSANVWPMNCVPLVPQRAKKSAPMPIANAK